MWDTVQSTTQRLSHDLPCIDCGHAPHTYLPCSDACACRPSAMPGTVAIVATRSAHRVAVG